MKLFTSAVMRFREARNKLLKSRPVAAIKKVLDWLLILVVWSSIVYLVYAVWDTKLIQSPTIFWLALILLLVFSAVFSSAETAFTILQANDSEVKEGRKHGNPDAKTTLEKWFLKHGTPSKGVKKRYDLIQNNIEGQAFKTLQPFLLVMNNLINLGGMYFIGRSLLAGERSENFSLVISAVIVVIVGEVIAKYLAYRSSAETASWTVLIVLFLKPALSWYTSRLVLPIEATLGRFVKEG